MWMNFLICMVGSNGDAYQSIGHNKETVDVCNVGHYTV